MLAADKQQDFVKSLHSTDGVVGLNRVLDSKEVEKSRRVAEAAVEEYSVISNPDWKSAPAVSNLDSEKRSELLEDLGMTLILLAQSQIAEWRLTKSGDQYLDRARLFLDRAESCYEGIQAPHVLWLMRADLAKLRGDKEEETKFLARAAQTPADSVVDRRLLASYRMSLGQLLLAVQLLKQLTDAILAVCWHGVIWEIAIIGSRDLARLFIVTAFASRQT